MNFKDLWRPWRRYSRGDVGSRGERLAAKWLSRRGFEILERNYHKGHDEADIIALDPDGHTVVIVEVKTRSTNHHAPELSITPTKQYRLARLAGKLHLEKRFHGCGFRFDAVAINWQKGKKPVLRHFPGAFDSPF